jgi:hypothetical protein
LNQALDLQTGWMEIPEFQSLQKNTASPTCHFISSLHLCTDVTQRLTNTGDNKSLDQLPNFWEKPVSKFLPVLDQYIGLSLVSRTLPGCYELRQYPPYTWTSLVGIWGNTRYICIYLPYTNFNTRFITASYQAKISLGPNTRARPVWNWNRNQIPRPGFLKSIPYKDQTDKFKTQYQSSTCFYCSESCNNSVIHLRERAHTTPFILVVQICELLVVALC